MTDEPVTSAEAQDIPEGVTEGQEAAAGGAPMRTVDVLRFALGIFADTAWIQLGIRADPGTGEVRMDLPQARLAIDAINALLPLTEGQLDPHEVRDYRNLLSGLQMNFVQRLSSGQS